MSRVPVLAYHGLSDRPSPITIPTRFFDRQMAWIGAAGLDVAPLSRVVEAVIDEKPLPSNTVVLTFDDGLESVYREAFPILQQHGYLATVFLVTDYMARHNDWPGQPASIPIEPILSWAQVAHLARAGMEFGAHTRTHPRLDRLDAEDALQQIRGSKRAIQDRLGTEVSLFAYPYGQYDSRVMGIVGEHFRAACGSRSGYVTGTSRALDLERIDPSYLIHPTLIRNLTRGVTPIYLQVRSLMRRAAGSVLRRTWK